jgi:hypothetical protein
MAVRPERRRCRLIRPVGRLKDKKSGMEHLESAWSLVRLDDLGGARSTRTGEERAAWPVGNHSETPVQRQGPTLPEELRQVATGLLPLPEALRTLAQFQQEQVRAEADLREREARALTAVLEVSEPVWRYLDPPTLHFPLTRSAMNAHLEVGRFAHLAALLWPSTQEQVLAASSAISWVRVCPHQERQAAGQVGALASAYAPISMAEAVTELGLEPIVRKLEVAARTAGAVLLQRAQALQEREAQLVSVELTFGWEPRAGAPAAEWAVPLRQSSADVERDWDLQPQWSVRASCAAIGAAVCFALIGVPYLAAVLLMVGLFAISLPYPGTWPETN